MSSETLIKELFSGAFGEVVKFFSALTPSLFYIGIFVVIISFVRLVIKKEINTLEDTVGFIYTRGFRFLILSMLWLPSSFIENLQVNGTTAPLGISILYVGAKASLGSADELAKAVGAGNMMELPATFSAQAKAATDNLESTYKSVMIDKDMVTEEQRSVFWDSAFGNLLKFCSPFLSYLASSLTGGVNENRAGYWMSDALITGDESLTAVIRDWIMSLLVPGSIIIAYYIALFSLLLQFVLYAPFFMISAALLMFDKHKDAFYNNIQKLIGLMLSPVGIVFAFVVCSQGYAVYKAIFQRWVFAALRAADAGIVAHLIVSLCIGFAMIGVFTKIYTTIHNFISNMLGASFHAGL